MVQFEVYDRETDKTVDVKTDKHFKDYGVLIDLDGHVLLTQYGNIVCGASERYGIRITNQN